MNDLYLSQDRYVAALQRQRSRIANGLSFVLEDSDAPGDRYTHASWGLCSNDKEAWPDRDDHLWPDQFDNGRVAPLYRKGAQTCPFDSRGDGQPDGCFYGCVLFGGKLAGRDRHHAINLYDEQIAISQVSEPLI